MIYLDHVSGTSPVPFSFDIPWANSLAGHKLGLASADFLNLQRDRIAAVLGVNPDFLYFTQSATESNAIIQSNFIDRMTSVLDHPSVTYAEHNQLPVDSNGTCDLNVLEDWLIGFVRSKDRPLVNIIAISNELGVKTYQDNDLSFLKGRYNFHLHLDGAAGFKQFVINDWVDSTCFSGAKFGAIGGGLLFCRSSLQPIYGTGAAERGVRPGTPSLWQAYSMALAAEKYQIKDWRPIVKGIWGDKAFTPPNHRGSIFAINVGIDSYAAMSILGEQDIIVSGGAACTSGTPIRFSSLIKIGKQPKNWIRVSPSHANTEADILAVKNAIDGIGEI